MGAVLAPYLCDLHHSWLAFDARETWREQDGSLLFFDISGFTPLTERLAKRGKTGVEQLVDRFNGLLAPLVETAAALGGDTLKFGGDALLLLFTGRRHAERACAAAWDMQAAMAPYRRMRTSAGTISLRASAGVASVELIADSGEWQRRADLADAAPEMARRVGDPATLARVLTQHAVARLSPHTIAARTRHLREALRLAHSTGERLLAAQAANFGFNTALDWGDIEGARELLRGLETLAEQLGQPTIDWYLAVARAKLETITGSPREAERLAVVAYELGQRAGQPDALVFFLGHLYVVRLLQGSDVAGRRVPSPRGPVRDDRSQARRGRALPSRRARVPPHGRQGMAGPLSLRMGDVAARSPATSSTLAR